MGLSNGFIKRVYQIVSANGFIKFLAANEFIKWVYQIVSANGFIKFLAANGFIKFNQPVTNFVVCPFVCLFSYVFFIANKMAQDQTAPSEQSDLGSFCLLS